MSGRYSPSTVENFPPLLRRLVRAAEAECPPGHAEALVVFIGLALRKEPPRGIFSPRAKPELSDAIRAIAQAHFEVDEALAGWRRTLRATDSMADAHDDTPPGTTTRRERNAVHFYAGLAFGLVFAGPCSIVP